MADLEAANLKLSEPTKEDLERLQETVVVEKQITTTVSIPPISRLQIKLLDSGEGGDPPFRLHVLVEDEVIYLDEVFDEQMFASWEKGRAILALAYRKLKGAI